MARGGLWVVSQGVLLCAVLASPWLCPPIYLWSERTHLVVGDAFLAAGALELAAGFISLGSGLTPFPRPPDGSVLCTTGAFKLVRHPIYAGLILVISGYCLTMASTLELPLPLIAVIFFDRKAAAEERWLVQRFPAYEEYRRRTKRFFPFTY